MSYWHDEGTPLEKLIVGIPMYGRGWTLEDPSDNGYGVPTSGPSREGPITGGVGALNYYEVCMHIIGGNESHVTILVHNKTLSETEMHVVLELFRIIFHRSHPLIYMYIKAKEAKCIV